MAVILLVEDDADLRFLYAHRLRREGHEVVTASEGAEALHRARVERPDCVVLDIEMEGMDGIETLGRLHRRDGSIPVLLHTAHPGYRADYRTWAAEEWVDKGDGPEALVARVRDVLRRSSV
jgi:two-component system OmpR family response regulator